MNTLYIVLLITAICSLPCGTNKNCTAPDNCTCINGWTGSDCLTRINIYYLNTLYIVLLITAICNPPCGTNKVCSAPNTCTCASGYGPLPNCPRKISIIDIQSNIIISLQFSNMQSLVWY